MEGCGSPVATSKRQGRLEAPTEPIGETGWPVNWCVGHLAGLAEPAVYDLKYDKWRREDLPILPENWRFTIGRDKREQFDILRTLLRREDVSEVVNACDAGREGALIFRTAYHLAGCTKSMKRLWISCQGRSDFVVFRRTGNVEKWHSFSAKTDIFKLALTLEQVMETGL